MPDDRLIWASARELRERIGQGTLSPVDLVQACLDRIDALDAQLRAFILVDRDGAMAAARMAEAAVRDGADLGPLHGLPIALKDDLWVQGMPATAGSLIFSRFVPTHDGTVARRLRAAGAIIIGKTNLPEFTSWPRCRSYVGGETRNPWDMTRVPGASSGGSAAAVAAGMVPLAIGTDGGGSVRMPAAFCGIVGLLPTIGRVPDHGGFLCSPVSTAGPMARNVADLAILQQVIAGFDPDVPDSIAEASPDLVSTLDAGPSGLRIGWSPDHGRGAVDPRIVAAALVALDALIAAGASVTNIAATIPHPWGDGSLMAGAEAAALTWDGADPIAGDVPDGPFPEAAMAATTAHAEAYFTVPEVRALLQRWPHLLTPPQHLIQQHRKLDAIQPSDAELRAVMDDVFARCDIFCSPTTPVIAPSIPRGWASPFEDSLAGTNLTFIANATGRPAVSVPCGLVSGMPVGFQIIGRPGDEATVLRVARAVERALPPLTHADGIASS